LPQELIDSGRGRVLAGGDYELDGVKCAGPDLHLLGRSVLDQLLALDSSNQVLFEEEDPVQAQDMGDEVVGEHRQTIEVGELGRAGASQVGRGDLGTLEKRDLQLFIGGGVGEAVPPAQMFGERRG